MFKRIVNFLDFLEKFVGPTVMMYIAVDGTAPLAKIIQQRKRRYKSELDSSMRNEIKLKYGVAINDAWSNTSIKKDGKEKFSEKVDEIHKLDKALTDEGKKYLCYLIQHGEEIDW